MAWWHKESGHQQPWHWPSYPGIFLFQNQKGQLNSSFMCIYLFKLWIAKLAMAKSHRVSSALTVDHIIHPSSPYLVQNTHDGVLGRGFLHPLLVSRHLIRQNNRACPCWGIWDEKILWLVWIKHRADSRFAPSQWETALLCNDVSHLQVTSQNQPWNRGKSTKCVSDTTVTHHHFLQHEALKSSWHFGKKNIFKCIFVFW